MRDQAAAFCSFGFEELGDSFADEGIRTTLRSFSGIGRIRFCEDDRIFSLATRRAPFLAILAIGELLGGFSGTAGSLRSVGFPERIREKFLFPIDRGLRAPGELENVRALQRANVAGAELIDEKVADHVDPVLDAPAERAVFGELRDQVLIEKFLPLAHIQIVTHQDGRPRISDSMND